MTVALGVPTSEGRVVGALPAATMMIMTTKKMTARRVIPHLIMPWRMPMVLIFDLLRLIHIFTEMITICLLTSKSPERSSSSSIWRERINRQKMFPPLQNQPFN